MYSSVSVRMLSPSRWPTMAWQAYLLEEKQKKKKKNGLNSPTVDTNCYSMQKMHTLRMSAGSRDSTVKIKYATTDIHHC